MSKLKLTEKGVALRAGSQLREADGGAQRREIVIIGEGWGSSGYYSAEVLERDIPRIFPVGTHMYLNHPTEREDFERPERSVLDLVGKIITAPRLAGIDMVAECEIYAHWVPVIEAMAEDIGLSIRAYGVSEEGDAGGKNGPIIKALTEGLSVDYVTKAGAKGKVGALIESAREHTPIEEKRNCLNYLEARIHREFTYFADNLFGEGYITREERVALSAGIGDGLKAFAASVEASAPQLLNRDPYADPDGEEVDVEENKAGSARPNQEDTMEVKDSEWAALNESVKSLTESQKTRDEELKEAKEKERKATERADRAEEATRLSRATSIATAAVAERFGRLPDGAKDRAVESAVSGELPVNDEGQLKEEAMKERAYEAAKAEAKYLAESGAGTVEGFGTSESDKDTDTTKTNESEDPKKVSESREKLQKRFEASGLSESAAKTAAAGRG